jgi:hypothetical protein
VRLETFLNKIPSKYTKMLKTDPEKAPLEDDTLRQIAEKHGFEARIRNELKANNVIDL